MNIFFREMKAHRKSLIIWCISIFLMVVTGMAKYAGFSGSGQSMNDILSQMPSSLKAVLGVGDFDVSKASGFYGILFLYLLVMATIHASMLGANIISKEERDKTAEFLMAKPVSRTKIITAKLIAALVNIFIFNIVTLVSSITMVSQYSKGEAIAGDIAILMVGMFILQLIFMFIGTGIASVSKNPKAATITSTGVLLFTFILSIVIDMNSKLESLKYITPFKYYEAKKLMVSGKIDIFYTLLSAVIIASLISVTYVFYRKRDLKI